MNFELASRMKLRFQTAQGLVGVEDLWDLPLTSTNGRRANLNDIAKDTSRELKAQAEEDFVNPAPKTDDGLQLKLDIVKHVIQTKMSEHEAVRAASAKREQKAKLLDLIAHKKDQELEGKSVEELTAMVEAL